MTGEATEPNTMTRLRTLGLFLLLAVLLGGAFPATKAGLGFVPPLLLATARFALAGVLIIGYALATTARWRPRTRNDWAALLGSGTFFIGGIGVLFVGQQYTTSGVAAIIFSLIPVLTPVIAWTLLPNERLSRRGMLGVLVGFVGVGIVIRPYPAALSASAPALFGQLLILLAAICVTLGSVLVRRSAPSMSVLALTGWAMLLGAGIQYGFSVLLGESIAMVRLTPTAILALLYLVVFASAIGYVVYFALLDRFGPLEINLVSYLFPVVAAVAGWLFLDEPITVVSVVGFLVIVAGFVLLKHRELGRVVRPTDPDPTPPADGHTSEGDHD